MTLSFKLNCVFNETPEESRQTDTLIGFGHVADGCRLPKAIGCWQLAPNKPVLCDNSLATCCNEAINALHPKPTTRATAAAQLAEKRLTSELIQTGVQPDKRYGWVCMTVGYPSIRFEKLEKMSAKYISKIER